MNTGIGRAMIGAAFVIVLALRIPFAGAQGIAATHHVYVPMARASQPSISIEQQVINLINQQRRANGCNIDLALSNKLSAAAYRHSRDMALNDVFSHTGSDGSTMEDRAAAAGYQYSALAENIAAGYATPSAVVAAWMDSEGHRENILNCDLRETGVGYYKQADDQANVRDDFGNVGGPYFHYWTQDFGTPQ